MQDTTPKQEWVAPRIVRLDGMERTEGGTNPACLETYHIVSGGMTSAYILSAGSIS